MSQQLRSTMSFSEEQSMLLDTALEFCKNASPIEAVRDLLLADAGFSSTVWDDLVALGWPGIAIPEEFGGSGLGLAALVPVVEPLGRHLLGVPFVSSQLAVQAIIAGGSEDQKAHWLPSIAGGSIGCVALTEQDGNWDLTQLATRVENGVLSGGKSLVVDANSADLIVVSAMAEGAPALVLVPRRDVPDSALRREIVLDETRRSYSVSFDNISLAPEQIISGISAHRGLQAIERAAWLLHSADACGGIHSTIELVVDYLNTRTQFGRKIGSYQSLKHPTVDMLTGLERARSHLYHSASMIAAGAPANEVNIALRMAKAESGDAYNFAADRAIQFHGGFGFTYECDAQLYLRRALWLQYQFGDTPHHRAALQAPLLDS